MTGDLYPILSKELIDSTLDTHSRTNFTLSKNSRNMRLQDCGTPGSGPSVDLASRSQVEVGMERAAAPEKNKVVTPWKINGWNRIKEVGKIIFLSKWVI